MLCLENSFRLIFKCLKRSLKVGGDKHSTNSYIVKTAAVSLETCQPAKIMPSFVISEFIAQYNKALIYTLRK